jgi:L-alanine-DL-glutamate epimerase-like enolase superfamily enzyme
MKIKSVAAFVAPLTFANGSAPAASVIVRIDSADGHSGYGEAPAVGAAVSIGSLVDQVTAASRALLGHDSANLNALADILAQVPACSAAARAALDIANYDLVGNIRGVPVHLLLGGALRTRFEVMMDLGKSRDLPDNVEVAARAYVARLGSAEASSDADRHRQEALVASAATAGARIEIDAGEAFESPGQVRRFFEPIMTRAVLGHLSLRQPLHAHDLEGHAVLRETLPIQVVLDRSVTSAEAAVQIVRRSAADRIVISLERLGGLEPARRAGDICESAGLGASVAAPPSVGLMDAAHCHLAATLRDPHPVAFATRPAASPVRGGVAVDGMYASLSERPGLGVEVDDRQLKPVAAIT